MRRRFYKRVSPSSVMKSQSEVEFQNHDGSIVSTNIDENIIKELDELQREYWRLEKREQRHTCKSEYIPDYNTPQPLTVKSAEQLLMERIESTELVQAIRRLTKKQQRRFLMQALFGLSISRIAFIEGCSEDSVKESLSLAKKKLRKILKE